MDGKLLPYGPFLHVAVMLFVPVEQRIGAHPAFFSPDGLVCRNVRFSSFLQDVALGHGVRIMKTVSLRMLLLGLKSSSKVVSISVPFC